MNQLQRVFDYQDKQVRTVVLGGEPRFVAKDVCDILEISNSRDALARLEEDEKGVALTDTLGGAQEMQVVTEPGLYSLVLSSRKPEARAFKRWITHEVIPSIRKHDAYMTPQALEQAILNPDTMIRILTNLKDEQEKRRAAEQMVERQRPQVLFAEAVTASKDSILVHELAKIIKQNGVDMGQNRLFKWLRQNKYLLVDRTTGDHLPTQRAMELGLFEINKVTIQVPNGNPKVRRTIKVTPKGQLYFVNKFLKGNSA
jgi:anti-repressor protein